jgi:hypothetical protein
MKRTPLKRTQNLSVNTLLPSSSCTFGTLDGDTTRNPLATSYCSLPTFSSPFCSRLILAGTVHNDERGFLRTHHFLHSIRPDLVFVELSPYARAFRLGNQVSLLRKLNQNLRSAAGVCGLPLHHAHTHPEIKGVRRQLALPFEYRAARRYSQSTGNRLVLVDYSPFSRKLIRSWPEMLTAENLTSLLSLPKNARPSVTRAYDLAARRLREGGPAVAVSEERSKSEEDHHWEKRERHMAKTIRLSLEDYRPVKALYLGGWQHLTLGGSFPSLRELLGIGFAQCCLLDRDFL